MPVVRNEIQMKALNRRISQWGKTLMALSGEGVYHSPEVLADCAAFEKCNMTVPAWMID